MIHLPRTIRQEDTCPECGINAFGLEPTSDGASMGCKDCGFNADAEPYLVPAKGLKDL